MKNNEIRLTGFVLADSEKIGKKCCKICDSR